MPRSSTTLPPMQMRDSAASTATMRQLTPRRVSSATSPGLAMACSSPSRPGSAWRCARKATTVNSAAEMARWMPSGRSSAMAAAAISPPATAPMDQNAWNELMIDLP